MRTVILIGAFFIADAIRQDWIKSENTISFLCIVLAISALMDIVEYTKNISKKN